jgi:hypothetical protein
LSNSFNKKKKELEEEDEEIYCINCMLFINSALIIDHSKVCNVQDDVDQQDVEFLDK